MNVLAVLDELGIDYRVSGDEATALCPNPEHQDRHPSWSINLDSGAHNCLAAETMVMTWDGPRRIDSLAGGEHKLLTSQGWQVAPVRSFGNQELWEVVVGRNGIKKTIRATAGHRWLTRSVEVTTDKLRTNHRLRSVASPGSHALSPSRFGVAQGFVYGDGTTTGTAANVSLWGEKDSALLAYYPGQLTYSVTSEGGVAGTQVGGLPKHWKALPSADYDATFLYGWLAGYFAADGCVDTSGLPILASSNKSDLEFVKLVCDRIGVFTNAIRSQMRKGFGKEESELWVMTFGRSTLTEDFFIIEEHRKRWAANRRVNERRGWSVVSVRPLGVTEEVFCAVVEGPHNFALEDNLLTGNCFACGWGGPLQRLVRTVRGIGENEAGLWIKTRSLGSLLSLDPPEDSVEEPPRITEAKLWKFVPPPESRLRRRGISSDAAAELGILWDEEEKAWILPIRDADGKLHGWQSKSARGKRVRNYPVGVRKGDFLFGLHVREADGFTDAFTDQCVLVESPLDVARLRTAGVRGGLASFGARVSSTQLDLVVRYFGRMIVAFDDDRAGWSASEKIRREFFRIPVWFFNYDECPEEAKDPGDLTDGEILRGVATAVHQLKARF